MQSEDKIKKKLSQFSFADASREVVNFKISVQIL